jgi:hypothetical protein
VKDAAVAAVNDGKTPHRHLMLMFLAELRPFQGALPAVGVRAMSTANLYWNDLGKVEAAQLVAARVAIWGYLDQKHGNSTTIDDREDHMLRATLCVLHDEHDDLEDLAYFFRDMVAGAS